MTEERKIPHTRGGPTTRDALDQGVPMTPGVEPLGPEDAFDPDTRGDYADRLGDSGESYTSEIVGHEDDGTPIIRMVRQK